MSKKLELTKWQAQDRLALFLKLRKGKEITQKTVIDFQKLVGNMWNNFKSYNDKTISEYSEQDNNCKSLALKAIRCGFMKFQSGGNCRLIDIKDFSYYKDGKYRADINGTIREITEQDFIVLQYIFFGER
jgi:hypothetical protein